MSSGVKVWCSQYGSIDRISNQNHRWRWWSHESGHLIWYDSNDWTEGNSANDFIFKNSWLFNFFGKSSLNLLHKLHHYHYQTNDSHQLQLGFQQQQRCAETWHRALYQQWVGGWSKPRIDNADDDADVDADDSDDDDFDEGGSHWNLKDPSSKYWAIQPIAASCQLPCKLLFNVHNQDEDWG